MSAAVESKISWAKIVNPEAGSASTGEIVAVIDIYREAPAATEQREEAPKRSFSQEIDPVAFSVAQNFYEQRHADVTATTRRNELERLYRKFSTDPQCEFPVVLFALAKGMKVVNVFNRGQDLEWHKSSKSTINRAKRSFSKPIQKEDGWTTVGREIRVAEKPSPKFKKEETVVPTLPDTPAESLSMDEIVGKIGQIKGDIKDLDTEIEALLVFHREHLREINRIQDISDKSLGQHLNDFHHRMVIELEKVLDSIQSEIVEKRQAQSHYCDMLKQ
jgi:hypothetical protein